MNSRLASFTMVAVLASTFAATIHAADLPQGYLCCNMRTDGSWISDSNYAEAGKRIIPAGTPVKATDYGRFRVYIEIAGGKQAIGNDYSRALPMEEFAKRYIVAADPNKKIAGFPPAVRNAIAKARLVPGMTREQVLMSVGYPMASENPDLNENIWRYWLESFSEYQVVFDKAGRLKEVTGDARVRNLVMLAD